MSSPGRWMEADRTLFVGNLESRVREEILYELFLQDRVGFASFGKKVCQGEKKSTEVENLEDSELTSILVLRAPSQTYLLECSKEKRGEHSKRSQILSGQLLQSTNFPLSQSEPFFDDFAKIKGAKEEAGPLIKVTICKDKEGKPKSFGFVCFKHKESVPYAIALLNGIRLYGRPIKVQYRFGSSYSSELSSPTHGYESCVDLYSPSYRYQEPCGSPPFPVTPFPVNNSLPHEYSGFQKMMNHFLAQQYMVQSPMGQQFPYYQMTPPLPSNFSFSPYQNQAANFKSVQSSFEFTPPHPSDCEVHQVDGSTSKRKREQQSCDSDTSIEDGKMRPREHDQRYRKHKAKKRKH